MSTYNTQVVKTVSETHDVATLYIERPNSYPSYVAGQYIGVDIPALSTPGGKAYSLSSINSDGELSITVKDVGGPYSSHLCAMKPGENISITLPFGFFNPETDNPLVLVASGVGISPVYSILRDSLVANPNRYIELWYGNKTIGDIVFRQQLQQMQKQYNNFNATYYISRQDRLSDSYRKGRICAESILSNSKALKPQYLLCGTTNFVTDIYQGLIGAGINDVCINTEVFFDT